MSYGGNLTAQTDANLGCKSGVSYVSRQSKSTFGARSEGAPMCCCMTQLTISNHRYIHQSNHHKSWGHLETKDHHRLSTNSMIEDGVWRYEQRVEPTIGWYTDILVI
jgi:hypothetical protein